MLKNVQNIRGIHDYLPKDMVYWHPIEDILKKILSSYSYNEIRLPIIEKTLLFKHAIGETADVIEKEMYNFKDYHSGNDFTLRPEGTAGCVRACINHGLIHNSHNQAQRFWYIGPMFRYERPQKGRYRQFYQLGAEVFGQENSNIDAELIMLTARCWRTLGVNEYLSLELNSIGSLDTRNLYRKDLIVFLMKYIDYLDDDCRHRLSVDPIKVLDTKNNRIQELLKDGPLLTEYLDDNSKIHFSNLCSLLDLVGIQYVINPRLVRGLNYYNRTVFEWVTNSLGSHKTVCAGGRYDTLVEQLGGGNAIPAVGFAIGLERLVLMIQKINPKLAITKQVDLYIIISSECVYNQAILLVEKIRNILPSLCIMFDCGNCSYKKQFARANKNRASFVVIFTKDKLAMNRIIIKNLKTSDQRVLTQDEIISLLTSTFS